MVAKRFWPLGKVDGHEARLAVLPANGIPAPIRAAERMAGIETLVALSEKHLSSEPLRRCLAGRPFTKPMPRLVHAPAHVAIAPEGDRTVATPPAIFKIRSVCPHRSVTTSPTRPRSEPAQR